MENLEDKPTETAAEMMPAETAPVETPQPKPSEMFKSRIKGYAPEEELADDEAYYSKAIAQLDDLEAYKNKNMEANKALMEIFAAEPAVQEVLIDMVRGASFPEAVARHFSPEELMPKEGDPDYEAWTKNSEMRSKRIAENEARNQARGENEEFSRKAIADFAKETNMTPEAAEEFLTKVGEMLDEVYEGKISMPFLKSMMKAFNYDNDVKTAEETGRIAGRNEKIEVTKDAKPKGDGLPVLGNSKTPEVGQERKGNLIADIVDKQKKREFFK